MFCQVNEYLRRGWRCQHLPSGQKGRAHISIVLTALHAGHRSPIPPPGRPRGCTPMHADSGRPRLNFLICQMGAGVQSLKKKILDSFFWNPTVPSGCGRPETPMCYPQVHSAQDAQCLSAVWLQGQNSVRLVGVPGEDPSPATRWEVAPPHPPAVLRPVRSRQALSRLSFHSFSLGT